MQAGHDARTHACKGPGQARSTHLAEHVSFSALRNETVLVLAKEFQIDARAAGFVAKAFQLLVLSTLAALAVHVLHALATLACRLLARLGGGAGTRSALALAWGGRAAQEGCWSPASPGGTGLGTRAA